MNWKQQLSKFEQNRDWESAIALIQETIDGNNNTINAYLSMNYLLMNLLVEEQYELRNHDYYAGLLKKYFLESYSKFSHDPEYLFYIGQIACISEWYFDIEIEEAQSMMHRALELKPNYTLYKWANYRNLDMRESDNKEKMILYAKKALSESEVKRDLKSKGALGKYLWNLLQYWSKEEIIEM
ncbi:hypothetical protein [Gelidibacter salicanalis]|uniref:Uncharacterized protein n=1 Tax=Gelidibacter salicanalis TaxID=291193 RepID=A0A934KMF6_9FLAO|nr:hypothetical protein [Gelidibacter salicanalis]MBJ7880429.1 hypothetical protein [Gelidibacter salicanalis]